MGRTVLVLALAPLIAACSSHKVGGQHSDMSMSVARDLAVEPDLPPAPTYTIGGTITGLAANGLVLEDNGGDDLPVIANSTTFVFMTPVASGSSYQVTVKAPPTRPNQTCTVSNGSGTVANANVTTVAISCTNDPSDWLQFNFDAQHDGWNLQETTLTAANVNTLKPKMHVSLPAVADGAPAYLRNVATAAGTRDLLFVVTKPADLIALDGTTLAQVWRVPHPYPSTCTSSNGGACYTTSSPAIDPNRMFVYSYGLDGKVHKHNVADGSEMTTGGWPEVATIKSTTEKGSSALSIAVAKAGTFLYASSAGYPGDAGDYQGHVTAINLGTGTQHVFNVNCSNQPDAHLAIAPATPNCAAVQSAVWSRAGVVYSADLDRIFFATGNGPFDGNAGMFDWGDTIVALRPDGTGTATGPLDSYTPTEYATLNSDDADLGSTAPAILPTPHGSKYPHLAVQSQKKPNASEAQLRLVNLDNLSGKGGPGNLGGEIEKINVPQGNEVLTAVAVWVNPSDGADWVFVANDNGISGIRIDVAADGTPSFSTTAKWTNAGGYTSPIVANGVLYVASTAGLQGLDPTTGHVLWTDASIGGVHWESPIVVNGQLYVTDENKAIWRYGF